MCFKMKTPTMPTVSQTGRDILPSYENKEPEAAQLGDDNGDSFTDITKRKGKASLKINKDTDGSASGYNPVSY